MANLEAGRSAQYVLDANGQRQAVLVDIDEWERMMGWLDAGAFSWRAVRALGELWSAGGDAERAGWLSWASFRMEWLPGEIPGDARSSPFAVRVRPAILQETGPMPANVRHRAGHLIDSLADHQYWKAGFRLNPMPVEEGWEVRWCHVDNRHILYAFEESLRQLVVLTIYLRVPYPA